VGCGAWSKGAVDVMSPEVVFFVLLFVWVVIVCLIIWRVFLYRRKR
jgi:hypothetical protein